MARVGENSVCPRFCRPQQGQHQFVAAAPDRRLAGGQHGPVSFRCDANGPLLLSDPAPGVLRPMHPRAMVIGTRVNF